MSPVPRDDPNKEDEDHMDIGCMDTPQFIFAPEDSDSEGEDVNMGGYQLLPQEPEPDSLQDEDESSPDVLNDNVDPPLDHAIASSLDNFTVAAPFQGELPPPPSTDASERRDLWNTTHPDSVALPMDPDHADKIRQAMAGFSLPAHVMPTWAKVVPEEEWKAQLVAKLHGNPEQATGSGLRSCDSRTRTDHACPDLPSAVPNLDTSTKSQDDKKL